MTSKLKFQYSKKQLAQSSCTLPDFFDWDSLYEKLNSHCKTWSYNKKEHKNVKAYRKSLYEELTVNRCLLILDLKPFKS